MGLFQKKPFVSTSAPGYRVQPQRTLLIIGLGNPGKEYEGTRHNIGFSILDQLAIQLEAGSWTAKNVFSSSVSQARIADKRIVLCKPTTFMNDSGQAVSALKNYYKLENHQILVIYDELALPFGTLRSRFGENDAGHNGVKSVVDHIGSGFGRLRVGIASDKSVKADTSKFVLAKFSKPEREQLPEIIKESCSMVTEFIYSGDLPHDTRKIIL